MGRSVRAGTRFILAGDYGACAEWAASAELDLGEWATVLVVSGPLFRVYELREDVGRLAACLAAERRTVAGDEHRRAAEGHDDAVEGSA